MTNVRVASRSALPPGLPLILAAASFGFTIVQLDVTIVNVALDAIGREFGARRPACSGWSTPTPCCWRRCCCRPGRWATGSDRGGRS